MIAPTLQWYLYYFNGMMGTNITVIFILKCASTNITVVLIFLYRYDSTNITVLLILLYRYDSINITSVVLFRCKYTLNDGILTGEEI